MKINGKLITADEGKILKRFGANEIYGKAIYLGYSSYIDGVKQDPPHKDAPSDFEEIDEPVNE